MVRAKMYSCGEDAMWMRTTVVALAAAMLFACSGAKKSTIPEESGDVSVRLLRIDPIDSTESNTSANFFLRISNNTAKQVTVKNASIEVSITDELTGGDDEPPKNLEPGPDKGESGAIEPGEGGGGDTEVDVQVFEGSESRGGTASAGQNLDIPVKVVITYPTDPAQYVRYCNLNIAHVEVDGKVETSVGILTLKDTGELPTPSIPKATAEDVQVARSGDSADFGMTLRLFNPNNFPFKIKDWSYRVYVGGKLMREATVGVNERIGANSGIQYDINIALNEKSWGPGVGKLISAQAIKMRVEGTLRFRDSELPTNISKEVKFST
jgi:LEA14-like dessication related protein